MALKDQTCYATFFLDICDVILWSNEKMSGEILRLYYFSIFRTLFEL